jgi:hypothetical protein
MRVFHRLTLIVADSLKCSTIHLNLVYLVIEFRAFSGAELKISIGRDRFETSIPQCLFTSQRIRIQNKHPLYFEELFMSFHAREITPLTLSYSHCFQLNSAFSSLLQSSESFDMFYSFIIIHRREKMWENRFSTTYVSPCCN